MTSAYDLWKLESPEDESDRLDAIQSKKANRSAPAEYRTSDYDRMIPQTGADGKTYYTKVNMLDYIQE